MATTTRTRKVKRTKDGTIDKRTKAGKAICKRMAKARRAKARMARWR